MINAHIHLKDNDQSSKPYPKLMSLSSTCTTGEKIVLMYGFKKGTVILDTTNYPDDIGHNYNDWEMSHFQDFKGTVTLNNG